MDVQLLIVDDEEEIQRTLRNFFLLNDFAVQTAGSGEQALEIIRQGKVHIVLSDIKMPRMDGIELLEEIRKIDFSIQVIMMTGFSTFDLTIQALERGAADYVLKPFRDLDEVLHLVNLAAEKLERWKGVLAGSSKRHKAP